MKIDELTISVNAKVNDFEPKVLEMLMEVNKELQEIKKSLEVKTVETKLMIDGEYIARAVASGCRIGVERVLGEIK